MATGAMIVRLKYLPNSAKAVDIRQFFAGIKIPDGAVHIIGGATGDAFIGFTSEEDGERALKLTGGMIQGATVVLSSSSKEEMERVLDDAYRGFAQASPPYAHEVQGMPTRPSVSAVRAPAAQQAPFYEQLKERDAAYRQGIPTPPENRNERGGDRHRWNGRQPPQDRSRPGGPSQHRPGPGAPPDRFEGHYPGDRRPREALDNEHEFAPFPQQGSGRRSPGYRGSGPPEIRREYPDNNYVPSPNESWNRGPPSGAPDRFGPPGPDRFGGPPRQERFDGPPGDRFNGPPQQERFSGPPNDRMAGPPDRFAPRGPVSEAYFDRPPIVEQDRGVVCREQLDQNRHPTSPDCCIEITNLPPDLLRPVTLEDFLRPMTPLSLSSVKMVQDQSGRPVALVRFPNPGDAQQSLRLDGNRGVYIRPISNTVFERAVEIPTAPPAHQAQSPGPPARPAVEDTWRLHGGPPPGHAPYSPPRRGRSRSPPRRERDRRPEPPRWERERHSPPRHRRRSRSRSPLPRRDASNASLPGPDLTPGNRYDVIITNVPFKVTIAQWEDFAAHNGVKYRSVTRTYYEDGNASDRWVMTFSSREDATRLLAADRTPLGSMGGRSLRMRPIPPEEALRLMAIPDKFGELRKEEYDRQRGRTEEEMIREGELPPTAFGAFSSIPPTAAPPRASKPGLLGPPSQNRAPAGGPGGRAPPPNGPPTDPTDERAAVAVGRLIDGPPTDMQMKIAKQLMMSGITPTKADLEAAANFDRPGPPGPGPRPYRPEMNGNFRRPPVFFNSRGHPGPHGPPGPQGGHPRPSRFGPRNY